MGFALAFLVKIRSPALMLSVRAFLSAGLLELVLTASLRMRLAVSMRSLTLELRGFRVRELTVGVLYLNNCTQPSWSVRCSCHVQSKKGEGRQKPTNLFLQSWPQSLGNSFDVVACCPPPHIPWQGLISSGCQCFSTCDEWSVVGKS